MSIKKFNKPFLFTVSALVLALSQALYFSTNQTANAQSTSCSIDSAAPANPPVQSDTGFDFQITDSSNTINWVRVTSPSANLTFFGANSPDWSTDVSNQTVIFNGGSIAAGTPTQLHVDSHIGNYFPPSNWKIEVSLNSDGSSPSTCSGSAPIEVSDTNPPVIGPISVLVNGSTVTISWSTDKLSDSQVIYGADSSYGQQKIDANFVTNHRLTITGLKPETSYHYAVKDTDQAGNSANSDDNTFTTGQDIKNTPNTPAIGVTVTNPGDKTPPVIGLDALQKVYKQAVVITGQASDDVAVQRVEYSTDGGKDWLPAENATGLNGKKVSFSIRPQNLDDGNYKLIARAIDAGGNITSTQPAEIVVDLLPPLVGGSLISLGAQILQPGNSNKIELLSGLDTDINLSAIGGATSVNIAAKSFDGKGSIKGFSLTQSPDTGLWKGVLSFDRPGEYLLSASSQDGAGNTDNKDLGVVSVSNAATIKDSSNKSVTSTVSVYYLDKESNSWQLWDGTAYSQPNPQQTDRDGAFNYYLPAGSYYVKAVAKGYRSATSSIVKLDKPAPLAISLLMHKSKNFISNHLSSLSVQKINLAHTKNTAALTSNKLIGQPAPDFSLKDTNGKTVVSTDLLGRPSLLSFMSSWSPTTSEQLSALHDLSANKDINIEPVAIQENVSRINAYLSISGYAMSWLTDPFSSTSASYPVNSLPTHYFIDRNGTIKKVVSGVLSQRQLLDSLEGL